MEKFDVIIVGAGPAGSSCAQRIIKNTDMSVLLLEAGSRPSSMCASGLNHWWLDRLNLRIPRDIIQTEIHSVKIHSSNETVTFESSSPMGYVTDRKKFDLFLLNKVKSEVDYRNKTRVNYVYKNKKEFKILTDNDRFLSDIVVDASGFSCVVGNSLGLPVNLSERDVHVAVQYVVDLPDGKDPNQIEFWFDSEKIKSGYVWSFPCSDDKTKLGAGVDMTIGNPLLILERFIEDHEFSLDPIYEKMGGLIPTYKPIFSNIDNCYLIGDAGRFCSGATGGGIFGAIMSGRIAGEVISDYALFNKSRVFRRLVNEELGKMLVRHYKIKKVLYSLSNRDMDRFLEIIKDFEPESTDLYKEFPRLIKFLLMRDPWFCLKNFLKFVF